MNEWMNNKTSERMYEWTIELTNERMNKMEWTIDYVNLILYTLPTPMWTSERMNKWIAEWRNEYS